MQFLFLDDSKQTNRRITSSEKLVGVGGVIISDGSLRRLEQEIESLCSSAGFPEGEVFKWSPSRNHWMRDNLIENKRSEFFQSVIGKSLDNGVRFVVSISDPSYQKANSSATSSEMDALILSLERFHNSIAPDDFGVVFVAKPSGGSTSENQLLSECIEARRQGTGYVNFEKFATNPVTMPFPHSRLMQIADLVVSCTTAVISGNTDYAQPFFDLMKPRFLTTPQGQIGGAGVKIHPSYKYENLHHWCFGDVSSVNRSGGAQSLPRQDRPFFTEDTPL